MTKEEIAVLGHAFFDGKTLQYKDGGEWFDWIGDGCPSFYAIGCEFRIKPDEPKMITICTFMYKDGDTMTVIKGTSRFDAVLSSKIWTHIKSLDQVVEVESCFSV